MKESSVNEGEAKDPALMLESEDDQKPSERQKKHGRGTQQKIMSTSQTQNSFSTSAESREQLCNGLVDSKHDIVSKSKRKKRQEESEDIEELERQVEERKKRLQLLKQRVELDREIEAYERK